MATLTAAQMSTARNSCERIDSSIGYTKAQINAALQACEDYFENTARAGFGGAMEAAAPGVFTAAQKRRIGRFYLLLKFGLEV